MLREELTAEDLLEYEKRNAWIYEARERFYEETKGMTDQEIRELIRERALQTKRKFLQKRREAELAGSAASTHGAIA